MSASRGLVLRRVAPAEVGVARRSLMADPTTLSVVGSLIEDVRLRGDQALAELATRFSDPAPCVLAPTCDGVARDVVMLLERTAANIRRFAEAQRATLTPLALSLHGGRGGHRILPVKKAMCYAPGGRYPLPSTVLMGAVTARVAGVAEVWIVTPSSDPIMVAAAAVAGADKVAILGGAQAIAAFAYGTETLPAVDLIVGPGNRYVTAAKRLVVGDVGIDLLGGPSELCVVVDGRAEPEVVAADLLAQAEHDPDARVTVLSTSAALLDRIDTALEAQCATLPTADVARAALRGSVAAWCPTLDELIAAANRLGPEHLQVMTEDPTTLSDRLTNYGGLFLGAGAAEVFGDYGVGPNHTLPTSGTSRYGSGLSVLTFLRTPTFLQADSESAFQDVIDDVAALARLEGLEAHARAAERRRSMEGTTTPS